MRLRWQYKDLHRWIQSIPSKVNQPLPASELCCLVGTSLYPLLPLAPSASSFHFCLVIRTFFFIHFFNIFFGHNNLLLIYNCFPFCHLPIFLHSFLTPKDFFVKLSLEMNFKEQPFLLYSDKVLTLICKQRLQASKETAAFMDNGKLSWAYNSTEHISKTWVTAGANLLIQITFQKKTSLSCLIIMINDKCLYTRVLRLSFTIWFFSFPSRKYGFEFLACCRLIMLEKIGSADFFLGPIEFKTYNIHFIMIVLMWFQLRLLQKKTLVSL